MKGHEAQPLMRITGKTEEVAQSPSRRAASTGELFSSEAYVQTNRNSNRSGRHPIYQSQITFLK